GEVGDGLPGDEAVDRVMHLVPRAIDRAEAGEGVGGRVDVGGGVDEIAVLRAEAVLDAAVDAVVVDVDGRALGQLDRVLVDDNDGVGLAVLKAADGAAAAGAVDELIAGVEVVPRDGDGVVAAVDVGEVDVRADVGGPGGDVAVHLGVDVGGVPVSRQAQPRAA